MFGFSQPYRLIRNSTLVAVVAVGAIGLAVLFLIDPADSGIYPQCVWHWFTGWHCPGCGSLRAMHRLLHADLAGACAMNPLLICILPLFAAAAGRWAYFACRGVFNPPRLLRTGWIWAILAIVLGFGVLRNLPFYPFHLLAPTSTADP